MSTASQVESFCESCGTRYAFEPRRSAKRHLVKVGRLVGILPDEPEVDDSALVISRDPFHGAFHFCLECRRFTCPTCWDAAAGFCRSCASVLSGDPASEPEYTLDGDTQALLRAAFEDLVRIGSGDEWVRLDAPPDARPEPVAATPDIGEAPADDLTNIIEAGVAAMAAREARAAREAAEAADREQARLEEERRLQAEVDRIAAEQAEAQRLAWEAYEAQRLQYEADLAAWEAAESRRLADEAALRAADEAQRMAADEAQRMAAEDARPTDGSFAEDDHAAGQLVEAERLAAEAEAARIADVQAEAERVAAQQAEAERLALEADRLAAQRAEAERLALAAAALHAEQAPDETVWESLAPALGPDVAAEEPAEPQPQPQPRPLLPPVPQVPPPPAPSAAWHMGGPPAGMPGWAPPPPAGFRPPVAGWTGNGHPAEAQLRTGIRPCPRCELALSANARFCRRCGLPQG